MSQGKSSSQGRARGLRPGSEPKKRYVVRLMRVVSHETEVMVKASDDADTTMSLLLAKIRPNPRKCLDTPMFA